MKYPDISEMLVDTEDTYYYVIILTNGGEIKHYLAEGDDYFYKCDSLAGAAFFKSESDAINAIKKFDEDGKNELRDYSVSKLRITKEHVTCVRIDGVWLL